MSCPDDLPEFRPHDASLLRRVFTPLSIAAYVTWAAVAGTVVDIAKLRAGVGAEWAGTACLVGIIVLFAIGGARPRRDMMQRDVLNVMLQGVLVVTAESLLKEGQTAVLLIIVAGQLVFTTSARITLLYLAFANGLIAASWVARSGSFASTLSWLLPVMGFQVFAAMTSHYAKAREVAREHLSRINAELLATRRLLEESARAGERLKLSRELHDVAGHSLTALKLNLARLARDPALAAREELQVSTMLADELLSQIRQVVGALRAHDGLDLRAALEALAHPLPGTRIEIEIDDGLRVDDIDQAEALLRCAQEAITNAVRHGRANKIAIGLHRNTDGLELRIDNDGTTPNMIEPGHGLTGMRERLQAIGGTLDVAPAAPRGLRLVARIPIELERERLA
jgi:signal transduction histidine kinase